MGPRALDPKSILPPSESTSISVHGQQARDLCQGLTLDSSETIKHVWGPGCLAPPPQAQGLKLMSV